MKKLRVLMVHTGKGRRMLNEAQALRAQDIEVDFLYLTADCEQTSDDTKQQVYTVGNFKELKDFLANRHIQWDIIHCHGQADELTALAVCVCDKRPVIHDCSTIKSIFAPLPVEQAEIEKLCLTRSSGVVYSDEALRQFAVKKYRVSLARVLPSYPLPSLPNSNPPPKLATPHLVYTGPLSSGSKQNFACLLPMFSKLCTSGLEVHVFPDANTSPDDLRPYQALAKACPSFKLNAPLPPAELRSALSAFKWGFSGFNPEVANNPSLQAYLTKAVPENFWPYIEAGVSPLIMNSPAATELANRLGLGRTTTNLEELAHICTTEQAMPKVEKCPEIDLRAQVKRLVALYLSAIQKQRELQPAMPSALDPHLPCDEQTWLPYHPDNAAIGYLGLQSTKKINALLKMTLDYYTSGVWLYKEKDIYFSHSSADTHAFYLAAFANLYQKGLASEEALQNVKSLLLASNNMHRGGNPGWGLGKDRINPLQNAPGVPTNAPATTTYTYTSSFAAYALLDTWQLTKDPACLEACTLWRDTFEKHIGLHPLNGCCLYADHISFKQPPIFIPNVTPLHMGFLAKYGQLTKSDQDTKLIKTIAKAFDALCRDNNWEYDNGRNEDLLHLGFIIEGYWLSRDILGKPAWEEAVLEIMLNMLFENNSLSLSSNCLGTSNWGPPMALISLLHRNRLEGKHIDMALNFFANHPSFMFYNIRTASIYAHFFSALVQE